MVGLVVKHELNMHFSVPDSVEVRGSESTYLVSFVKILKYVLCIHVRKVYITSSVLCLDVQCPCKW